MTKQSAFDALCQQHHELLTAYGPFGWGRIAIEVAQDEQRNLIAANTALYAALEELERVESSPHSETVRFLAREQARAALALARGGVVDGQGAGVEDGGEKGGE